MSLPDLQFREYKKNDMIMSKKFAEHSQLNLSQDRKSVV